MLHLYFWNYSTATKPIALKFGGNKECRSPRLNVQFLSENVCPWCFNWTFNFWCNISWWMTVTIFDYIYNGDSHGNHSWRLWDSNHFHWNSLEKSRNFHGIGNQNGWGSSQLLSIKIPWNSTEFRLSTRNLQELMEKGKDLWNCNESAREPNEIS